MLFNREYISAIPVREEQRLSEEEELARQLKREARIFFPDKKLPDFDTGELPPLPEKRKQDDREASTDRGGQTVVLKDHDRVCREEDSLWRKPDGSFSHHETEAARQEAEQVARNRKRQLQSGGPGALQADSDETGLQNGGEHKTVRPRLNKQDIKRGIRLTVILDKPRGLTPWKGDNFQC